eukprot:TRINITY_DN16004_c0_g1_i2.p1 TRINITY_DN16004_c0_g1~~TRINITY_DN16004_c0_g1_i2.p1  ORF type:complete len:155 (-),score=20.76 TRINITY_DN16004_c0_g1_i2:144-608(-)
MFFFFFFKQKTAYEMLRSLVGSEMCIRDRCSGRLQLSKLHPAEAQDTPRSCCGVVLLHASLSQKGPWCEPTEGSRGQVMSTCRPFACSLAHQQVDVCRCIVQKEIPMHQHDINTMFTLSRPSFLYFMQHKASVDEINILPVSYTHLTLPTKRIV